jgi:hypothetical protein
MNVSQAEVALARPRGRDWAGPVIALLALLAGLWNLAGPAMWWDEGWTLSVARNWAERGFYGRLLDGQPAPPGLEAAITVTGPVALSFRLLGVGVWQGRLVGVLFLAAALLLLYALAARLYSRRIAVGTLFVALLMPMHPQLHPLIMARQVLAETPMFAYMLLGYLSMLLALTRSRWWLVLAVLGWGIGVATKAQALPFCCVSLLLPIAVVALRRRWDLVAWLGASLIGAVLVSRALPPLARLGLRGHTLPVVPIAGLYSVTALVLTPFNRLFALQLLLIVGLPTLLGLAYAAWRQLRPAEPERAPLGVALVRLAMLGLAGSWLAWYVLLSVGVPRYMFPATFFGSLFAALLLHDLTCGFDLRATLGRAGELVRGPRRWQAASTLVLLVLLALSVAITALTLNRAYLGNSDTSAADVATFLNTQTPATARVETYESELHFLLNRSYHYPPDQLHVELNRRSLLQEQPRITYDPLVADPEYLVVGRFARENELYQPAIDRGVFRELRTIGGYVIYQRMR